MTLGGIESDSGDSWHERDHPVLDVLTWLMAGLAGIAWLVFSALLVSYLTTDWSAQREGTLQMANGVLLGLAFMASLLLSGLASFAAFLRYRRIAWLVLGLLLLTAVCALGRAGS
ncbi:hypothetical protein [Catellatospora tritici]|uniref:hypothetical protein n=1 Tax=Catellatospora tritici TaxID=2851566 RepID=UPI001C2D4FC1|nr:hypothetical protein [Catellatospora tritici]MBV1854791.1 hypothetical protein [Catellatospora tritici]